MTYIIYADVILVNNFTMDFLLLTAVRKMMKLKTRRGGLVIASLAGAFFALAVMIVPLPVFFLQTLVTCVGLSTLMAVLAFQLHGPAEVLRAVAGLYLAALMAAGVMQLLPFGWFSVFWLYGAAAVGSVWLTSLLWRQVSLSMVRSRHLYQVELFFGEKKLQVTAFLDTGNHLTEPVTGAPVCVLWSGALREAIWSDAAQKVLWENAAQEVLWGDAVQEVLQGTSSGEMLRGTSAGEQQRTAFRENHGFCFIPFRSIGRESGILPAVRADRMEIQMDGWRQRIERPYIAISDQPLSQNGSYQMLLNEKVWS